MDEGVNEHGNYAKEMEAENSMSNLSSFARRTGEEWDDFIDIVYEASHPRSPVHGSENPEDIKGLPSDPHEPQTLPVSSVSPQEQEEPDKGSIVQEFLEDVRWQHDSLLGKMSRLREVLARHLGDSDEREDVQKKTFAKWINSQLAKGNHPLVTDLFYDLRDGTRLLGLLEVLTGSTYKREKGKMRVHHLNNVSRGLNILEQHNVKLVNISNDDIVDGSAKLTLGLVWSIILHWQVQGVLKDVMADLQQTNLEKTLLAWCRQTTKGYHGVDVRNFTTSWTDGLAFNALIHRHRPDLFDWPTVAKKLPFARLEQAFRLANKEFGIERLLDPEDVNTQVPDKKSMMMYIMCLFQALPKASFTMESLDVSIQSDSSFSLEASGGDEKNRPLSTVSIGLGGYQRTLEEVLTWLLGAEDRLAAMPPIAEEPEEVKQQFHQLEDLMLELTAKQGGIGDVLGEGTRLLKEGVMGEEEEEEVRVQMKLLNTRWEDLRVKAMDRQTQLHDCLMQLQQSQLENLKSWLTATEDRISKMSEVGPTTEDLKAQVVAHHKLQQDLEGEQANINSLSNMVVVVDEGNSDAAYSNLEDELNALGERWAHICRWAEQRWTTLQVLTVHWEQLEREMEKLGKWLDENEAQLKQMESNPSTDQEHLLRQAGTLQVLQSEMDIQQRRFALLQEESSKVLSNLPKDSPAQTKIPETLENLQDRWDCLVAIIEAQNQRLAASGIDIKRTDFPSETDGSVVSSSTSTITHEGATMITKVITTKTTTTKHVEEGSFKRQKLEGESYEEFNVALNQLGGWMDTVQERLQPKQTDDLSYEQLVQLCQHLQDEVQTQQEEYNKVMSLGQSAISETATIGECSSESESKVTDFAARWQALSEMMANLQSRIEFMAERKKLTAELSAMEIHYQGFQRWFDNVRTVSENEPNAITSQVEQCKTKIAGMKSHEQRLNEMNQTVSNLSSKWPIEAAAIVHSGKEFIEKWEALLLKFVDWGNALSSELEKQPPQSYLEALTALKRWLTNVEAAVTTEPLVISKLPVLSDQLQNYKELLKTVEVEESSLAYINRTGNELLSRSEVNIRLKGDLVELNKRWESAVAALKSRVENVEKAIEMLGQYRDEVSGLKSWLAEVDVFLHAEDAALGDIETLEAQLEQSNALQDDISTLETNVNNIKTTSGHIIQETNDEELRNEVSQQVKDLSDRWDVVLDLARRQNKSLKDALAKSQKVHEDISKLNMWLDKLELEFPPVKPIETSSELSSVIGVISKLREDIANHTDTFRSVNEIGNEMLQYENVTSHDDMARQFTLLNGRWTDIISQIDRRHKTLTKATEQYAQFQVLCEEETSWLDQLEQKLEKSSKSAADAEEISEALDDLEIFLHGHHEERLQKVQELAEQLVQEGVMTFAVQNSTHDLTSRFNSLNAQANEQRTTLEGGVQEAQAWEREYISVLEWLTHTDVVITQAVADPSTHLEGTDEVLKELTRQQEVLAKMEAQVQVYQSSGKLEAAQRLEDQVVHLKKKYEEVQGKLQQLNSAPSDFDVRLKTMDAQLHDISQNVQLVSLTAGNPTAIQDQLNLCLQLYRTLSEVKGEVESVIATGRKIVKENQTSNPEGLTQQLDQLKALYNELGKAVTEQRGILEQSLRQSKKILKDGQHLEDWLSTTEHELDTREATVPLRSVQHELHFAQHALEDLGRKKPLLSGLQESYVTLTSLCGSEEQLLPLREHIDDVALTWERVYTRLCNRLQSMESEQDEKKDEMEKFIVGLGEVKGWLEVTENKLSNLTKYPAEERANIIKKVSQEVQDYKGQIESIRDTSVELISHGELFESRVQPELVTINQRWEHIFKTVTREDISVVVSSETSVSSPATTDDKNFDTPISSPTTTTTFSSDLSSHSTISTITKVFTTYATTYATTSADTDTGSTSKTNFPSSQLTDQTVGEITKVIGVPALSATTAIADVPVGGTADVPGDFQLTYSSTDDTFKDLTIMSDEMETSPEPLEELSSGKAFGRVPVTIDEQVNLEVTELTKNISTSTTDRFSLEISDIKPTINEDQPDSNSTKIIELVTQEGIPSKIETQVTNETAATVVERQIESLEAGSIVCGEKQSEKYSEEQEREKGETFKSVSDKSGDKSPSLSETGDCSIMMVTSTIKRKVDVTTEKHKPDPVDHVKSKPVAMEEARTVEYLAEGAKTDETKENISLVEVEEVKTTFSHLSFNIPGNEALKDDVSVETGVDYDEKKATTSSPSTAQSPLSEKARDETSGAALPPSDGKDQQKKTAESETEPDNLDELIAGLKEVAEKDIDPDLLEMCARRRKSPYREVPDSESGTEERYPLVKIRRRDDDDLESLASIDTDMAPASETSRDFEGTFSDLESVAESVSSRGDSLFSASYNQGMVNSESSSRVEDVKLPEISSIHTVSSTLVQTNVYKQENSQILSQHDSQHWSLTSADTTESDFVMDCSVSKGTEDSMSTGSAALGDKTNIKENNKVSIHDGKTDIKKKEKNVEYQKLPVEKLQAMLAELDEVMGDNEVSDTEDEAEEIKDECVAETEEQGLSTESQEPMDLQTTESEIVDLKVTKLLPILGKTGPVVTSSSENDAEVPIKGIKSNTKTVQFTDTVEKPKKEVENKDSEDKMVAYEFTLQEIHVGGDLEFGRAMGSVEEGTKSKTLEIPSLVKVHETEVKEDSITEKPSDTMQKPPEEQSLSPEVVKVSVQSSEVVHGVTLVSSKEEMLPQAEKATLVTLISRPVSEETLATDNDTVIEESEAFLTSTTSSSLEAVVVPKAMDVFQAEDKLCDVITPSSSSSSSPLVSSTKEEGRHGQWSKDVAQVIGKTVQEEKEKQEAETAVLDMKVGTHKEVKQKDSSLPSTSKVVTHVMTKTTITTTSTSSSSSSQVPRPDEDQVDIYLREVSSMSDRITALKYKTKDIPHFNEAKEKVEGLEHEVALLEPDVATVISRGDTLTLTTHMVDVPRANSIRLAVNDLRQQWSTLKADTEHLKNETDLVNQEIENYPERVDVLITWLNEVTKRLDIVNNDESQLEALEREMASKKEEIDKINETGERMKKYQYAQLQPIITLINTRWTELTMQFRQYRKVPHETKTIVPGSKDSTVLEPSKVPDYVASVNRLREAISAISRQLNAPLMNGREFDNLNAQEEELKVIKQGLDTLKPRVDSTETEREAVMSSATPSEADQVRRVVDKLRQEWAQVNRGYTEHHARWLHASESIRALHKMTEDFSVWLSSIEEKVQITANQPLHEAKITQKDLEKQVTLKHRPSQNLQTKCKEITEEMNVDDGRRLQDHVDNLMKRWRSLLLDLAARRERIATEETGKDTSTDYEDLVTWLDQVQGLVDAPVNVTDEASLSAHITMVQNHVIECGGKQVLLKRLKEGKSKGVTPAQIATLDTNMTKIANLLPEYKSNLDTKQGVIKTLGDNVEDLYKWTEEMRVRVALHNLTQDEIKQMRATLREKTAWYESLDSTYWVLAQDAESKGLTVSVDLKNRMNSIESRLKALQAQLAESSAAGASTSFAMAAPVEEQENKKKVIVEAEVEAVKEDDMASSMSSSVTSSVTTVIHNVKMEESVLSTEGDMRPPSPLVCPPKHSPDSSPAVVLASLDKSILQIRDWLTLVEQMVKQQTAVVGDSDDIRTLIEKQKSVLRELESKKPQLDELVASADSLKDEDSRTQLHQKVSKLREHWDETNSSVLQRKTQLDVMMADTHKFYTKRVEVDTWLMRLEARMERMAPVAHTADILDQQIREQKGIHAELHQYKHQMELFNQMTQRLITIYQHDDTRKIKKITETINMRYSNLSSSIIARGKVLHSAMNSLHNFDKALDKFRAWLSETESLADQLDMEVDKLGPGRRDMQPRRPSIHLKDLQSEIESHKDVLASLNATGQKLLGTLDNQDEAVMLQRRLEEMNQRWNNLKHKSMAIRNRLEGNAENWNSLLLSLRELIEWVIRKDTELNALGPLVGDISSLSKYEEDLSVFRRVLDEKQPVIESNLKSGRQLIASEPPLSDTSDSEAGRDLDGDNRYRGEETARDLTRSVRREVAKLSEKWAALRERAGATASQANLANKKLGVLQKTVEEVGGRLEDAEKTVAAWGTVPQDPNLADQHVHNVKKFREGLADLQRGVDDVNDQAARFSAHNVPLTPANSARLHDLNNRWKTLETTVNDRWRQLAGRSREVTPMTPAQLASSVAPPWERATASNKVPYYINHDRESTHWDHPDMMELLDSMAQYNHIKFSAYRTAMKLRTLQKKLALEYAKLQTATGIFDEHGLRGQNDRLIDVNDMVVVLSALYASIASDHPEINTTLAMDLCLNWLLNVYDSQRTGQMRVLSFKVGLVCLCTGHLEEKYRYMFRLIADLNRLVDQRKLGLLLHDCVQVPRQLGEVAAFGGSNIEPSVRSCFTKAGKDRETIEAVHFLSWVQQEPQSLVWLAVLHRVAASENVHHQVKCNICKAYPVVGLRYRCLKCLSFDMCQQCFFGGRSNKSHKVTHPMHEYCTATTTGEDMKDFTKALKNKFKSKRSLQKHAKKGYLPVQTVLEGDALESPAPSPQHNVSSQDMHTRLEMYASRLAEVELRTNSNSTPDSEDEHGLIAQYCQSLSSSDAPLPVPRSPLQIMAAVDAEQKEELEAMIRDLEEENKVLQAEYDRLKAQKPLGSPPEDFGPQGRSETDMIAEAKLLREHKGRLEARMSILEEHNRQLEAQLHRLRQLLEEPSGASSPNKSGTLQTKSVTASQLAMDSPAKVNGHSTAQGGSGGPYEGLEQMSEYVRPPPPPLGSMSHVGNLFSRAGDLGKAVGTLVATMTDEGEKDSRSSHHSTEDSE